MAWYRNPPSVLAMRRIASEGYRLEIKLLIYSYSLFYDSCIFVETGGITYIPLGYTPSVLSQGWAAPFYGSWVHCVWCTSFVFAPFIANSGSWSCDDLKYSNNSR